MPKRIGYCSDGMWNSGAATNTNVHRLYNALEQTSTQKPFYDPGVGTQGSFLNRLWGGAFGDGLIENVKEGYGEIARHYQDGDEIYLFDFSRGAYTARSLGGMIAYCGLPTEGQDGVDAAFNAYRNRPQDALTWSGRPAAMVDANVVMVGVWDTVGTLVIPGALFGHTDAKKYGFLNTTLNPKVQAGYHALAVDEKRRQYPPTLWDEKPAANQTIEQVWFAGVHGDVGGFPRTALSDITLAWMLSKAMRHGVYINPSVVSEHLPLPLGAAAALDDMDHSWNPFWGLWKRRAIPPHATVANSVDIRLAREPGYAPLLKIRQEPSQARCLIRARNRGGARIHRIALECAKGDRYDRNSQRPGICWYRTRTRQTPPSQTAVLSERDHADDRGHGATIAAGRLACA